MYLHVSWIDPISPSRTESWAREQVVRYLTFARNATLVHLPRIATDAKLEIFFSVRTLQ